METARPFRSECATVQAAFALSASRSLRASPIPASGRTLDRIRIHLPTGVHRLWELAAFAEAPEHPATMASVAAWVSRQ